MTRDRYVNACREVLLDDSQPCNLGAEEIAEGCLLPWEERTKEQQQQAINRMRRKAEGFDRYYSRRGESISVASAQLPLPERLVDSERRSPT